ncbi:transposase [Vibrio methylphosphonaticus]|uniref:transposase n=1 Tax=Vibrio methylphosphonaticus TaxID=2946866 RepID=UPI00202A4E46|nr:transposase [Vibrio methylphosphonaticus]MCL9775522.1 transposase [Vibrio methylphosphonaticus]
MGRKHRVVAKNITQHITQRGHSKKSCFYDNADRLEYLKLLLKAKAKYPVDIHAWVLMSNHIHLLATPTEDDALVRMMQSLNTQYVRYFNRKYSRSGSLWEGRYRSFPIETERYMLEVYRYIELNPVRAGIVMDPKRYLWSSYKTNACGKTSVLVTAHSQYLALANTQEKRILAYNALFDLAIESHPNFGIRVENFESKTLVSESNDSDTLLG